MSHRRQRVGVGVPLRPAAAAADAEGKRVMLSAHDNPSNEQTNATLPSVGVSLPAKQPLYTSPPPPPPLLPPLLMLLRPLRQASSDGRSI